MNAIPQLQRLTERIGAAVTLAPEAMGREIQSALREATADTTWLPAERRRVSHENYARHLLYDDPDGYDAKREGLQDEVEQAPNERP